MDGVPSAAACRAPPDLGLAPQKVAPVQLEPRVSITETPLSLLTAGRFWGSSWRGPRSHSVRNGSKRQRPWR